MQQPTARSRRAMGDVSIVKRSARQRSGSTKVRVFDEHTRKEIKRKQLAALEQDNWHEERRVAEEDDDEDYNPLDDGDDSDGGTQALPRVRGVVVHAFLLVAHILFLPLSFLASQRWQLRAQREARRQKKGKSRNPRMCGMRRRNASRCRSAFAVRASSFSTHRPCSTTLVGYGRQPDPVGVFFVRARAQEILDEAEYHKYPSWVPNYASIAAAPSRYPPRNFCSVTGLASKYKCPVTGVYLATMEAYETHRETRLKGLI